MCRKRRNPGIRMVTLCRFLTSVSLLKLRFFTFLGSLLVGRAPPGQHPCRVKCPGSGCFFSLLGTSVSSSLPPACGIFQGAVRKISLFTMSREFQGIRVKLSKEFSPSAPAWQAGFCSAQPVFREVRWLLAAFVLGFGMSPEPLNKSSVPQSAQQYTETIRLAY